jgi:hypothetical protein
MLALADELKNISRACQLAGISRTHFYDIKDAFSNVRALLAGLRSGICEWESVRTPRTCDG